MKKVTLYSPGLASYNVGDKIIADAAKKEMSYILDNAFVTEIPTHTPHSFYYMRPLIQNDLKFVLGSNLLKSTFFGFKRQWDITLLKSWITGPCVLVGVGWWQYKNNPNFYTKLLLNSVLDKNYVHSVRDDYTKSILEGIGIKNVINTSCPTMWALNQEHCYEVNKKTSENVVFTLTDYNKDVSRDLDFIDLIKRKYKNVYFWPQGIGDFEYITQLGLEGVDIIPPSLEAFDHALENLNVDYIGTRLHGGVRALQKKVKTLILAIDNRAREKSKSFGLPVAERGDLMSVSNFIAKDYQLNIRIPEKNILEWKSQF
ncbi:polysaccharide pyruvyl transferase family protein [Pseudoalteromonas sp. OANN1]|uniref:polysaccharide pyruvyl transferase family protein n=1 Tax=Pseudoalteromonas sp. OANN1 TaxID=2954497 RepID=UPI002096F23B|nr:polysaccharide pyruvyl transferase family protein [Pseudoalteromonas sp. OANN1]MCO7198250.1 polysaccharide pyruvyl transferase family protein [Pseudoalteromonas sp. OANN1]